MNKSKIITLVAFALVLISLFTYKVVSTKKEEKVKDETVTKEEKQEENYNELTGIIMSKENDKMTILGNNNSIYTLDIPATMKIDDTGSVSIKYNGTLDSSKINQDIEIVECISLTLNEEVPSSWNDNGIFSQFYKLAYADVQKLTLDEKIAQLLLVSRPTVNDVQILQQYQFGGILFFGADFRNKNKTQVIDMVNNLQDVSKIPLITAVDEEGGTVVRVSSNTLLYPSKFKSPRDLYGEGGLELIKEDTVNKNKLLKELGLNVNLAPVVDIATNPQDFMYYRSLGQNAEITSQFAKIVIETSKNSGVSYTLKHFPGYGNNVDTHTGTSTDERSWEDIKTNDLLPFQAGIKAGAESVLVSHNIVTSVDSVNAASISPEIHNILRNDLNFTGIIMTDDIEMDALDSIEAPALKAILAGNDLIITHDYEASFNSIKNAITENRLSEEVINKLAFRVIAWKYYKGLMYNNSK